MRSLAAALVLLLLSAPTLSADSYKQISGMRDQAKEAIADGSVDAARDFGPMIAMLRTSSDDDDQRHLVEAIVDLGRADGSAPAAVKTYVIDQMTPVLLSLAEKKSNSTFLRGDAITALRDIGAPREALEKVSAMALRDSDDYVKSRGEILQNYVKSMPAASPASTIRPKNAAAEKEALEYLRKRDLNVSVEQLHRSAFEANVEEVRLLLAAGVDPNGSVGTETPLSGALTSCSNGGETDAIAAVVDLLVSKGADVNRKDDNKNTPLFTAAQYCGAKTVARLIQAGAKVDAVNGSGMTPLMIALVMGKFDAAESLAAKGAKLNAQQSEMMRSSVTDVRGKAIVKKASRAQTATPKKK